MKRTEIINALFLPVGNKTKHLTSRSFVLADFGRVKALKSYSCTKSSTLLVRKPLWHWTVLFWWFQYKIKVTCGRYIRSGDAKKYVNITNIVDAPISKYKGLFRCMLSLISSICIHLLHKSRASIVITWSFLLSTKLGFHDTHSHEKMKK